MEPKYDPAVAEQLRNTHRFWHYVTRGLVFSLWLAAGAFAYDWYKDSGFTLATATVTLASLISTSPYGVLLFLLVFTFRPLLFIPSTILTILAGTLFGFWWGFLYTMIGSNLGSVVAYGVGYFFGSSTVSENDTVPILRHHTFLSTLIARLSFLPHDLISYSAGLLRLPFSPYLLGTILGNLASIITFVSFGAALSLENIANNDITLTDTNPSLLILSLGIFVATLGVTYGIKHYQTRTSITPIK